MDQKEKTNKLDIIQLSFILELVLVSRRTLFNQSNITILMVAC